MAEIIRMPRMSDTMEEGNIVSWLKKVGDAVEPGDVLAEVETDKATMELESFQEGYLLHIGVEKGAVPVDSVIAVIGDKDEDITSVLEEIASEPAAEEVQKEEPVEKEPIEAPVAQAAKSDTAPAVKTAVAAPASISVNVPSNGRTKASPLAKKMAVDAGINLTGISGSGEGGRIIKRDIEELIKSGYSGSTTSVNPAVPVAAPAIAFGDHEISQMRKVIAKRLGESKFSAPHFYLTVEIDMDNCIAARKAINADGSVKVSFNTIIVKATAAALRKHPMINASWLGDKITVHEDINIGVAVAVPEGLVVPVIRNTDFKSLSAIDAEVRELAGKARDKKIQLDEMQGNTFTISNLGMFKIDEFTAIINAPDACILAVGSIVEKPVVKNGQIAVGNTMKLTLSCDHRIVDGAKGAEFLLTLRSMLEDPVKILV